MARKLGSKDKKKRKSSVNPLLIGAGGIGTLYAATVLGKRKDDKLKKDIDNIGVSPEVKERIEKRRAEILGELTRQNKVARKALLDVYKLKSGAGDKTQALKRELKRLPGGGSKLERLMLKRKYFPAEARVTKAMRKSLVGFSRGI